MHLVQGLQNHESKGIDRQQERQNAAPSDNIQAAPSDAIYFPLPIKDIVLSLYHQSNKCMTFETNAWYELM